MLRGLRHQLRRRLDDQLIRRAGTAAFDRRTENVRHVRWLGRPIRQNPLDIWTIQELIVDRDVDLVFECGTLDGGSAYFVATVFDLLGRGHVITIDLDATDQPPHDRITYLNGSSTAPESVAEVERLVAAFAPKQVLVVLDSDHSAEHVFRELQSYASLVPVGGYIVVQDGVVDELRAFKTERPGPLVAIERFLIADARFEVDEERSGKFLFHYSPKGCLRRVR